jgi:leucyl-tRNA synthetase
MPHLAEELGEILGFKQLVALTAWPKFNPELAKKDSVTIGVQVNGKLRGTITIPAEADVQTTEGLALANDDVKPWVDGKEIKKIVVVPGRIVNIVVAA